MSQFMAQIKVPLHGVLRWEQWDALIERLVSGNEGGWYVYYVGEPVPVMPVARGQFRQFLREITDLLRNDHREDHLGIVYADSLEAPTFIKIYDPNDLGAACGSSGRHVLPGWTISRSQPVDLHAEFPNPGGRRRWWNRLFGQEGRPGETTSKQSAGGVT